MLTVSIAMLWSSSGQECKSTMSTWLEFLNIQIETVSIKFSLLKDKVRVGVARSNCSSMDPQLRIQSLKSPLECLGIAFIQGSIAYSSEFNSTGISMFALRDQPVLVDEDQ